MPLVAITPARLLDYSNVNRLTINDSSYIDSLLESLQRVRQVASISKSDFVDTRMLCVLHYEGHADTLAFGQWVMSIDGRLYDIDPKLARLVARDMPDRVKKSIDIADLAGQQVLDASLLLISNFIASHNAIILNESFICQRAQAIAVRVYENLEI